MDAVCLGTARGCLPRQGHRYMQRDAMDVHYRTVTVSDSGRSLSVLSAVELRLIVVVVYTWSATVMSELDCHQTAPCAAETAEHFES